MWSMTVLPLKLMLVSASPLFEEELAVADAGDFSYIWGEASQIA